MSIKKISIPPNYFYISLLISALSWWFFPRLNIIFPPYNLFGWIIIILGIFFTFWSYQRFRKYNTPEDFTQSRVLVKDGHYKYTRNPMYLGMFLITMGVAICFRNLIGLAGAFGFFLVMNFMFIPFEEEKNKTTFGVDYKEYKKRVRKWI